MDGMRRSFEAATLPDEHDFAFHLAIAEASGNELFGDVLRMVKPTMFATMAVGLGITLERSRDRARRLLEEHGGIADAISRGDAYGADLAMRYHIDRSRQRLTDHQRDL
jgi:DNA-binding FadR family transcriptional regulator